MLIETWKALDETQRSAPEVQLHKGYAADEIKVIESERQIRFVISTSDVDRDRDTIDVNGWDLTDYRRNPVVQWAHDYRQPPVARAVDIMVSEGKLKSLAQFPESEVYPFGDTIYRMLKAGYLNATSVGFRPTEWVMNEERRGVDFKRQILLEFSVVPIPANPQALIEARSHGVLHDDDAKRYLAWAEETLDTWHGEKGLWLPKAQVEAAFAALAPHKTLVIPDESPVEKELDAPTAKWVPRDVSTELADQGESWSRPTLRDFTDQQWSDLSVTQRRRIAGHFAYSTSNPPEAFGDLALPHHRAADGYVVWRGVASAAARMPQSSIPDGDMAGVRTHLGRHYRAFDKTPPWESNREAWDAYCKSVQVITKDGGVPSDADMATLLDLFGFTDEARAMQPTLPVVEDALPDDTDDLLRFLSSPYEDDHHVAPHDALLDIEPEQLRETLAEVARESINEALKRQMTAITGRLYD